MDELSGTTVLNRRKSCEEPLLFEEDRARVMINETGHQLLGRTQRILLELSTVLYFFARNSAIPLVQQYVYFLVAKKYNFTADMADSVSRLVISENHHVRESVCNSRFWFQKMYNINLSRLISLGYRIVMAMLFVMTIILMMIGYFVAGYEKNFMVASEGYWLKGLSWLI